MNLMVSFQQTLVDWQLVAEAIGRPLLAVSSRSSDKLLTGC